MRAFTLLTLSCAALSLSACGIMSKDDAPPTSATQNLKDVTPVAKSAVEEKEMAAMMGETFNDEPAVMPESAPAMESHMAANISTDREPVEGAPTDCPGVEVLPDTKSITYFDGPEGKPSGAMIARAALTDIKGGCDYSADGVVVDIDMIMQGKISDKGRYEGRKDLEAFMTFPYFVAVMNPEGKMVDKKIMATAMRFKPEIDDLDHAEKITQTIPLDDIAQGPDYTITVGFQLNRAQLDYNRGTVSSDPAPKIAPKQTPSPAASQSAPAKMQPIAE